MLLSRSQLQLHKFASTDATRPVLNHILFRPDGTAVATDGHRLCRVVNLDLERDAKKKDKATKVASVVDVSGLEADPVVMQKQSSRTALNGMYSLDSFSDVQEAVQYFTDSWTEMKPEARHEFSVKTASRAEELGIEVPELMQRYGATTYSPDVDAHIANRRQVAPLFTPVWNDLQEKRAMIDPEVFASLLKEADEHCGLNYEWGGAVFDPYYATFGGQHETEKLAWAYETDDGAKLTEDELKAIPSEEIQKNFSSDFAEAFASDPVTIFDSMPADTKQVIARMALA